MKKEIYSITKDNFKAFLKKTSEEAEVYIPVKKGEHLTYATYDPDYEGEYTVDEIRASEPIKSFLTCSRERVDRKKPEEKRQVIFGVKNCDLTSLAVQDFVFKDSDPQDPFYTGKRENTVIISADCNMVHKNCFCVALGIMPYAESGFDINLSRYAEDFLVEAGSEAGRDLIAANKSLFTIATVSETKKRISNRQDFTDSLRAEVQKKGVPDKESIKGAVKKSFGERKMWEEFASTCIECGGCNHCCPSCHCFALSDEKRGSLKARFKSWDACLYNRFAVVAGGANPRRHLYERLRNRFDKKFEFFPNVLGAFGCTGCGRCIQACPGEIDIRDVLKKALKG